VIKSKDEEPMGKKIFSKKPSKIELFLNSKIMKKNEEIRDAIIPIKLIIFLNIFLFFYSSRIRANRN